MKKSEEEDDFFELPDEIPYAKVENFRVDEVKMNGNKFSMRIYKKCEEKPEEKDGVMI